MGPVGTGITIYLVEILWTNTFLRVIYHLSFTILTYETPPRKLRKIL